MGMSREEAIAYLKRADATVGKKIKTKTAEALEIAASDMKKLDRIGDIMHIEMNGKEALQEIERILRG